MQCVHKRYTNSIQSIHKVYTKCTQGYTRCKQSVRRSFMLGNHYQPNPLLPPRRAHSFHPFVCLFVLFCLFDCFVCLIVLFVCLFVCCMLLLSHVFICNTYAQYAHAINVTDAIHAIVQFTQLVTKYTPCYFSLSVVCIYLSQRKSFKEL